MELRYYQQDAVDSVLASLRAGNHPVVQLATGGGKSLIISELVKYMVDNGGSALVVTHSKELVSQNSATYKAHTGREDFGIYCGGLDSYKTASATFATIQSIYDKPLLFANVDAIIIDEAHAVPPDNEGIMYNGFLLAWPHARKIGLTATQWRLDGGLIYGDDRAFNVLAYSKSALELIAEGYLSPLIGVTPNRQLETAELILSAGDYVATEVAKELQADDFLGHAILDSVKKLQNRKRILIFTPTIEIAKQAAELYTKCGIECAAVVSESSDREATLDAFRAGELKALANVNILTTGFDAPDIDAIVNFRPTESSALWVQMLGRGTRRHEGKTNCLILDYAGNLTRLGGLSMLETWIREKPDGDFEPEDTPRPRRISDQKIKKAAMLDLAPALDSSQGLTVKVKEVDYVTIRSRRTGQPMVVATYATVAPNGVGITATQFVCVEHEGYARRMAEKWFAARGASCPSKAYLATVDAKSLPTPSTLSIIRREGRFNVLKEYF